jgi:hypothetical protein
MEREALKPIDEQVLNRLVSNTREKDIITPKAMRIWAAIIALAAMALLGLYLARGRLQDLSALRSEIVAQNQMLLDLQKRQSELSTQRAEDIRALKESLSHKLIPSERAVDAMFNMQTLLEGNGLTQTDMYSDKVIETDSGSNWILWQWKAVITGEGPIQNALAFLSAADADEVYSYAIESFDVNISDTGLASIRIEFSFYCIDFLPQGSEDA